MSKMAGTIAGDFFCMLLDEHKYTSRLPPRVSGLALAGALLAELVISGQLDVTDRGGGLQVLDVMPPGDPAVSAVGDLLRGGPEQHDLGLWLSYLARTAYDDVAGCLVAEGVVRPVSWRTAWGHRRNGFEPVGTGQAWPAVRLAAILRGEKEQALYLEDAVAAGLAQATGLIDRILWDSTHHRARENVPRVLAQLPPPLAFLLARTEGAVGDAMLSHRT